MIMRPSIIYMSMLAAAFLTGCSYDKGNYDYIELSDPEISGIEDMSVLTLSELKIVPEFGEGFDQTLYDYKWEVIDNNGAIKPEEIGTGRTLDYEVKLQPGSYTLYYTVTEKASGVFWRKQATLTVSSSTSEGWMVLCSDGGRARLDFISDVTGEVSEDILSSGSMPQWNGPRRIQWLSGKTDESSPFYLFTDEGATRLGKDAFEWRPEYDFSYEVAVNDKVLPRGIVSAGFGKVVVSDGNAYYCEVMGFDGLYGSAVNRGFKVSDYVGANVLATQVYAAVYLLYDVDNKKLKAFCPLLVANDFGGLEPVADMDEFAQIADGMNPGAGLLGSAFQTWPEGYDCLYMENTRYAPGNDKMGMTYVILTREDECMLYGVQLGDLVLKFDCTYTLGKGFCGDLSGCTDIMKEGNLYAFSSIKNYMYYASGGNVYRVNLSQTPLKEELQFTLEGEDITLLKFNLYQKPENMQKSYDLIVGTSRSGEGILRVYEGNDSEGDFSKVEPTVFDGFKDIVDVTYKERIY